MGEFEDYLRMFQSRLGIGRAGSEPVADEIRDHLESRVSDLMEDGMSQSDARQAALQELGDAASFAREFQSVFAFNRKRWVMRFTTMAVVGSFLMLLVGYAIWPSDARIAPAERSLARPAASPHVMARLAKRSSLRHA